MVPAVLQALDSVQIIVLSCFAILVVSFFVSIATTKLKENLIIYTRVFIQLLIGLFILLPNFGQDWEVGSLQTRTQYKAGCGQLVNASLGVNIGIRSVNITLRANTPTDGCWKYEVINYNERLMWSCDQTKSLQKEVIKAKHRGVPKPIVWIMEYFSGREVDAQYGRFYCTAALYCRMCMWGAFLCYLVAVVMFQTILSYGAYYLACSGVLLLLANLLWYVIPSASPLQIYFENGYIVTKFGFSFWMSFSTGVVCFVLALIIIIMEYKFEKTLYMFFGVDPVKWYDEIVYLSKRECTTLRGKKSYDSIPLRDMEGRSEEDDSEYALIYYRRGPLALKSKVRKEVPA